MAKQPKPALGTARPCILARVSSDEQAEEGYSLAEQVRRARVWCQEHLGVDVPDSAVMQEEGVSGRPGQWVKRPKLRALLEECKAGTYTHLVVFKLDRLGRNVKLMSDAMDQLTTAGVTFVSIMDNLDASTAAGRLYITIFSAIAQWFSDNLSELVTVGKEGRRRAGLPNGKYPFGAMTDPETGIPAPDRRAITITGRDGAVRETCAYDALVLMFEMSAAGHNARDIAHRLNEMGYLTGGTHPGRPFGRTTVQQILENRFYLGELQDGKGGWLPGKHAPLISPELWSVSTTARARHRKNPQTIPLKGKKRALGGGLLLCAECWAKGQRSALNVQPRFGKDYAYGCYHRRQEYGCNAPPVVSKAIIPQVTWILREFQLPQDDQARMAQLYHEALRQEKPVVDVAARLRALDAREGRVKNLYTWGHSDEAEFHAAMTEIRAERAECEQQRMVTPDAQKMLDISAYIGDVARAWDDAEDEERYELARLLFLRMWVYQRRIIAFEPTPEFAPYFAAARMVGEGTVDTNNVGTVHRQSALAGWQCTPPTANILATLPDTAIVPQGSFRVPYNPPVQLTPAQRQEIATRYFAGEMRKTLAAEFGLNHSSLWKIAHAWRDQNGGAR